VERSGADMRRWGGENGGSSLPRPGQDSQKEGKGWEWWIIL